MGGRRKGAGTSARGKLAGEAAPVVASFHVGRLDPDGEKGSAL